MGFKQGAYAKVWKTTIYEKYTVVSMSTSKRVKATNSYETDFQYNFVKFVGQAHRDAVSLKYGDKIKIGDCEVTRTYIKDKNQTYENFAVYSFELESTDLHSSTAYTNDMTFLNIPDDAIDDLPFS